jgi:hypothetical protein
MAYDPTTMMSPAKAKLVSIDSAGSDAFAWTGLPARIKVTRFLVHNPSTSLSVSVATLGLRDAAAGAGNIIVTPALLTALSSVAKNLDMVMALTDVVTTGALYARNVLAHGAPATVDILLEYLDLT